MAGNPKHTKGNTMYQLMPRRLKPYYQDKTITIYHGDCREIVPQLGKFDLLLTDPPYGIGEAAGKNASRGKRLAYIRDYGNDSWDNEPIAADLIGICMSASHWHIIFGGNYYALPASSCWLVWDKDNGASDFADCELAWTNFKTAVRKFKFRWNGMIQENMKEKEVRFHPTQKPTRLLQWCIEHADRASKQKIETILDPFMGSGTTLRAAKDLGRKAVGIEREEKYCEIAAKRMSQEVLNFA